MNLETVERLAQLRVRIPAGPAGAGPTVGGIPATVERLRRRAVAELQAAAEPLGVDVPEGDVVVEPDNTRAHRRRSYLVRWHPREGSHGVELRGGFKDGLVIYIPSPRQEIEFVLLADNWREFAVGDPGAVLPKTRTVYRLAGYDETARRWFYEVAD